MDNFRTNEGFSEAPQVSEISPASTNIDTNTPSGETPQIPDQRTVADFYRGIADQVTPDTPEEIMQESANLDSLNQQQQQIDEQKQETGFFDIKAKLDLNKQQKELTGQHEQTTQNLQDLRSPAQELNSNIASDQEVARTLNPTRLEDLAKANEPLPGQEAAVRVADLSPEQIAERRQKVEAQREAREAGQSQTMPLPEDNRTEDQKQEDFENQTERYREVALEKLATRLSSYLGQVNENYKNSEGVEQWEINSDALKVFSEVAYNEMGDIVMHSDIEKGFWGLKKETDESKRQNTYLPDHQQNNLDYIESRAKNMEILEGRVLTLMSNWQMAKEISESVGIEPVSPQDFLEDVKRIETRWEEEDSRYNHYMKQSQRYRRVTDNNNDKRVIESVFPGGLTDGLGRHGSYAEGIVQDIADMCGKSPLKISREDISTIISYYSAAIEKGFKPVWYSNFEIGIEMALAHALINNSVEGSDVNSIDDLVKKMRGENWRSQFSQTIPRTRPIRGITRGYLMHMNVARKFDLTSQMTK